LRKLIAKLYLDDPELCGSCHKPMKIVAVVAPEQEDVVERILRHLQIWDPPWKRQRKARGPPSSPGAGSKAPPSLEEAGDGFDSHVDDNLYAIDPAPPGDEDTAT
jgi:hypothetical protein